MDVDIADLKGWIGREDVDSEILTPRHVRQFNAIFERTSGTGPGDEAPQMIHLCLAQPVAPMSELGRDGHPALGGFLPPVPLPRRMWAGGSFDFKSALHIGDVVTRRSSIVDVELKTGRSGPLCFVRVRHEITVSGRVAVSEIQDIVYRDFDTGRPPRAQSDPAMAPAGVHRRRIRPHPTLLFRYSALAFNGHRIHYDRRYCLETEGYPGLVVHGPLQATLLCQFASDLRGAPPANISVRSHGAIFDDADFALNATADGDGMRLWTARDGGPAAMQARAAW